MEFLPKIEVAQLEHNIQHFSLEHQGADSVDVVEFTHGTIHVEIHTTTTRSTHQTNRNVVPNNRNSGMLELDIGFLPPFLSLPFSHKPFQARLCCARVHLGFGFFLLYRLFVFLNSSTVVLVQVILW